MLKPRVIGLVLVRDGLAVQSIGFSRFLPIGTPEIAISYLDRWGIDEIVVLHIDAAAKQAPPQTEQVRSYAKRCQVPLAVGGGLTTIDDLRRVIQAGADKVVVNSALMTAPAILRSGAELLGAQCMIASIDARRGADGTHEAFTQSGSEPTYVSPADLARRAESLSAGEILITSIDQDGSQAGYDLDLTRSVVDAVGIPVIACGGAGHPDHMLAVLGCGVSGAAAGNFLHFMEHSVIALKEHLVRAGQAVRLDSYVTYEGCPLDPQGRIAKRPDDLLEELRFRHIPEERI